MGRFIKLLSLVTMLLIVLNASAQERVKVSGTVTDKYEGIPVIGATVTWGDGKGTTTDIVRKPPRAPQLEETPEMPPSSRAEGLLFLHGLESNPGSSLQMEEEAGLP